MAEALKVLVVDDNEALTMTLCLLLEILGHSATPAHSGAQAIVCARREVPDVVLMDLTLPDQSGYDACQVLRRMPALADTRFIANSGRSDRNAIEQAYCAGFQDYLVKPVSIETLEHALASVRPVAR